MSKWSSRIVAAQVRRGLVWSLLMGGAAVLSVGCGGDDAPVEDASSATAIPAAPESMDAAAADDEGPAPGGSAQAGPIETLSDVAEASIAGVVNVSSKRRSQTSGLEDFFGRGLGPMVPRERVQQSLGSGVVVSKSGVILTNNHVVAEAVEIRVSLSNGREIDAKLVGADPPTDLAVLQLEEVPDDLEPLRFGDSDRLRLGEVVLAIGNPLGVGQTVTMGIVSATGRANLAIADYEDFIQTDAAINPGNSGGALINSRGELVGINTAIASRSGGYQGIGFAIPAKMAHQVMESLIENGRVIRGWLGVTIQDLTSDLAEALDLDADQRGVLVTEVASDSPAEEAGLESGDVIVELDDEPVQSSAQLRTRIASSGSGSEVDLEVLRGGKTRSVTVTLGTLQASAQGAPTTKPKASYLGLELAPLDDVVRRQFGIPGAVGSGVAVVRVEPGSLAERSGLRPGDVIESVGRSAVGSIEDFEEGIAAASGTALLRVRRGGRMLFAPLKLE